MIIDIPATLTASYSYWRLNSSGEYDIHEVIVSFGSVEVVNLEPIRKAGRYADDEEREAIAQETVAKWLRERLA